ncbi:5-formyltetrahydrofolate cyclo-ligase [Paenibacillus sp. TAF43_2]
MVEPNQRGDKAYIRSQITIKRNKLPVEQRRLWSEAACTKAMAFIESHSVGAFMVYVSFRSELDLSGLIEWGWRTGREVIAPRCIAADRSMELYTLRSWDDLIPGAYGILEPNPNTAQPFKDNCELGVVFVPGLAFDLQGGRLGYGGGYYDRFAESFQNNASKPYWLGIAFEAQLIDEVPLEGHDLKMDGLITEKNMYLV